MPASWVLPGESIRCQARGFAAYKRMHAPQGWRVLSVQSPTAIDKVVGSNLRRLRIARGMTEAALCDRFGIRLEQIQAYESGTATVSASDLVRLIETLECSLIELFRDDLPADA
jgi:ribosome-binding protein aMBF1 (putative translation factor)